MVFSGIKDRYEDTYDTLGVCAVAGGESDFGGAARGTASEERASEIADCSYDHSEMVAAVPETIIGGLVAENLRLGSAK